MLFRSSGKTRDLPTGPLAEPCTVCFDALSIVTHLLINVMQKPVAFSVSFPSCLGWKWHTKRDRLQTDCIRESRREDSQIASGSGIFTPRFVCYVGFQTTHGGHCIGVVHYRAPRQGGEKQENCQLDPWPNHALSASMHWPS